MESLWNRVLLTALLTQLVYAQWGNPFAFHDNPPSGWGNDRSGGRRGGYGNRDDSAINNNKAGSSGRIAWPDYRNSWGRPQTQPQQDRARQNDEGSSIPARPMSSGDSSPARQMSSGGSQDCGTVASETLGNRIFGGEVAQIGENPWLALLQYRHTETGRLSFQCGGVLINTRYVLTAAHCTDRGSIGKYRLIGVRLGEYDTSQDQDCEEGSNTKCADPAKDFRVEELAQHERYGRQQNDIALLRLNANVQITRFIRPICLPGLNSLRSSPGMEMKVAGWGRTEKGKNSDVQMQVELPVVDNAECSRSHNRTILDTQMCAGGEQGKDSCRGDSGGPLMASESGRYQVHGIVSFGPRECGTAGRAGVYTKVTAYLDWMRSKIKP